MTVNYNPNSPTVLGLEHAKVGPGALLVNSLATPRVVRFTAGASSTLDQVFLLACAGSVAPTKPTDPALPSFVYPPAPINLDLVPRASEVAAAATVDSFQPTALSSVDPAWTSQPSGGAMVVGDIDNPPSATYAFCQTPAAGFTVQFGTGAFSLSRQVLGIRLVLNCYNYPAGVSIGQVQMKTASGLQAGPLNNPAFATVQTAVSSTDVTFTWGELFWDSFAPTAWGVLTAQSIRDFASGGTRAFRIYALGTNALTIFYVRLDVFSIPERRVATGHGPCVPTVSSQSFTVPAWAGITMKKPDLSGAFSTVSGTDYSLIVRQPTPWDFDFPQLMQPTLAMRTFAGKLKSPGLTVAPVTSIDTIPLVSPGPFTHSGVGFGPDTSPVKSRVSSYAPLSVGADSDLFPAVTLFSSGTERVDSQPYAQEWGLLVSTIRSPSQTYVAPASQSMPLLVLYVSADFAPTSDLSLRLRITAGAYVTVAATLTAAQVLAAPAVGTMPASRVGDTTTSTVTVRRLQVDWSTFGAVSALVSTTNYTLEMTSGTPDANPWLVAAALLPAAPAASEENFTFGAATQHLTNTPQIASEGSVVSVLGDLMATIATKPATPVGFTATIRSQSLAGSGCVDVLAGIPASIQYAHLAWTATGLGAAFLAYLVERLDPITAWMPIAYITAEASNFFDDYEGRLGVLSSYRVSALRLADGAASDPSPVATAQPAPVGVSGCGYAFTTNEAPTMNLAFPDQYDKDAIRDYTYPEPAEVLLRPLYGRDNFVAFHPTERRGTQFTRSLLLNSVCVPNVNGPLAFSPLRALAWASLSYVCVRDGDGSRWFANIQVTDGHVQQPAQRYSATVAVAEVTKVPSTPDVR